MNRIQKRDPHLDHFSPDRYMVSAARVHFVHAVPHNMVRYASTCLLSSRPKNINYKRGKDEEHEAMSRRIWMTHKDNGNLWRSGLPSPSGKALDWPVFEKQEKGGTVIFDRFDGFLLIWFGYFMSGSVLQDTLCPRPGHKCLCNRLN